MSRHHAASGGHPVAEDLGFGFPATERAQQLGEDAEPSCQGKSNQAADSASSSCYLMDISREERVMEDKRLEVLKSMHDHYDGVYKRVHYLFVGNGAGLVGGLAFLKDYTTSSQYHGIGVPIALFGIGLLAAIASYITLWAAQMNAKNSVLDRKQHPPSMLVFHIHYGSLAVSCLAFVIAVGVVIYRVAAL